MIKYLNEQKICIKRLDGITKKWSICIRLVHCFVVKIIFTYLLIHRIHLYQPIGFRNLKIHQLLLEQIIVLFIKLVFGCTNQFILETYDEIKKKYQFSIKLYGCIIFFGTCETRIIIKKKLKCS